VENILNKWIKSYPAVFVAGILSGIALVIIIAVWAAYNAPSWLVVEDDVQNADIAVVLGGGGGSRLRKGISLYDTGVVKQLLLVDKRKGAWTYIQDHLCPDCRTDGKDVVILDGSVNTISDATLVAKYCKKHGIDSILVITDPYHSRRALIIFNAEFEGTAVEVSVVNSEDYVGKLSPHEKWWQDNRTVKVIWGEISRIFFMYMKSQ